MTLKPVVVKSYESNVVVIAGGVMKVSKVVVLGVQKTRSGPKVGWSRRCRSSSVIGAPVHCSPMDCFASLAMTA